MSYTRGICQGVTVTVRGKTPESMEKQALDQAILFMGAPDYNHSFKADHYLATIVEKVEADNGTLIRALWEADITIRLVDRREGLRRD